jgi:hypothetical protein
MKGKAKYIPLLLAALLLIGGGTAMLVKIAGRDSEAVVSDTVSPSKSPKEEKPAGTDKGLIKPAGTDKSMAFQASPSSGEAAPSSDETASEVIVRNDLKVEAFSRTENGIQVSIDPRIELLAMVQLVSDYDSRTGLITDFSFKYKETMKQHFARYADHPAVKLFEKLSREDGFSFSNPPAAMLYFSNPPELKMVREYDGPLSDRIQKQNLDRFADELRDFAEDTNFSQFYLANEGFYNAILDRSAALLENHSHVEELESYYGMKQNNYHIILSPLYRPGSFGIRLAAADGRYDLYHIAGPFSVEKDIPIFGNEAIFQQLTRHGFGHSFIAPSTDQNRKELDKYSSLYKPLSDQMEMQGYGSWEGCVNEHINRAVICRLIYQHDGESAYIEAVDSEKSRGFRYIEPLLQALEVYEGNRDKYKSFEDFYPEIINVFKELSEKNLEKSFYDFTGPINAIYYTNKPRYIIVSTNEASDQTEQDILKSARYIANVTKQMQNVSYEIITDEEALKLDPAELGGKNILAYGTMGGNLWLKKYAGTFPFRISKDKITADKIYEGKDLRFITALPNPLDGNCALIIYTAQRAESIPNIDNVFHGPTDFVIAEVTRIIASGDYDKSAEGWKFKLEDGH